MNLQLDPGKIAAKLEAAGVPESVRDWAVQQVTTMLQTSMASRLEASLTDEQLIEFQKLAEHEDTERGVTWLREHFPDYEQMVDEELTDIVDGLKETVTKITKA